MYTYEVHRKTIHNDTFQHNRKLVPSKLVIKSFTQNANKLLTPPYPYCPVPDIHCGTTSGSDHTLPTYVHLLS